MDKPTQRTGDDNGSGPSASTTAVAHLAQLKKWFLATFAACGNVSHTAKITKVGRRTHYNWLQSDPEYAAAWEEARAEALGVLEVEARRRAVDGVPKVKFHQGKPLIDPETQKPYIEREYSDVLLIFLLKALDPATYGDKATGHNRLNVHLVNNADPPDIRDVGIVPEQRESMMRWRKMVEDEGLLPGGRMKSDNGGAAGGNGHDQPQPPTSP